MKYDYAHICEYADADADENLIHIKEDINRKTFLNRQHGFFLVVKNNYACIQHQILIDQDDENYEYEDENCDNYDVYDDDNGKKTFNYHDSVVKIFLF